jgi:hypothetical protein
MKTISIFTISLFFSLASCNNDVKIVVMKNNKECRRLATCFTLDGEYNKSVGRDGFWKKSGNYSFDIDLQYAKNYHNSFINNFEISKKENIKFVAKAQSLAIRNFSESKVYSVRVQRKFRGKVKFKDYKIEPTEEICIGCDSDFELEDIYDVHIPYYGNDPWEIMAHNRGSIPYEVKIKKMYSVEYKIHDITVLSEY